MTIQDLVGAAQSCDERFQKWFSWVLPQEIDPDANGNIPVENQHDGAGYTVAGLTQRDDGITVITDGIGKLICTNSPQWFIAKYLSKYWNGIEANLLPYPVGECVSNFYLNTGEGVKFLQRAINLREGNVATDNVIGPITINAALNDSSPKALAIQTCTEAMDYYSAIARNYPPEDLIDWTRRTSDLQVAFCS
jgi:lysozyme family protein